MKSKTTKTSGKSDAKKNVGVSKKATPSSPTLKNGGKMKKSGKC